MKIFFALFISFMSLSFAAEESYLSFVCIDEAQEKELYVYEPSFVDAPTTLLTRDQRTGQTEVKKIVLTFGAHPTEIMIWNRPTNHGGSSVIFHAKIENNRLIGNGFGVTNAICMVYVPHSSEE
jgi:hypothetical protein